MAVSTIDPNGLNVGQFGNRNLIINGAMQVAQRGTSATNIGYGSVDRWRPTEGGLDQCAFTHSQDTDAPAGFSNSYKLTITTAETGGCTGDETLGVFHAMEAQNLQHLGYGTSEAQHITISFWVKSSVTGAYSLSLYENDDNRNIGSTYTINSANTWEYKTITFPPDTVGVIDNNNGGGLETYFFVGVGPVRKASDNTSWATWSAARFGYGQEADLTVIVNSTWQITGVQLEVSPTGEATPFEHRSYGDELQKCQRYYQRYGGTDNYFMLIGNAAAASLAYTFTTLQTRMRAAPTFSTTGTMSDYRYQSKSGDVTPNALSLDQAMEDCVAVAVTTASNALTAGHAVRLFNVTNAGYFAFDAEL